MRGPHALRNAGTIEKPAVARFSRQGIACLADIVFESSKRRTQKRGQMVTPVAPLTTDVSAVPKRDVANWQVPIFIPISYEN